MAGTVINNCERGRSHAAPVINFRPPSHPSLHSATSTILFAREPDPGRGGFPYQRGAYPRYIDFNQARLISEAFFFSSCFFLWKRAQTSPRAAAVDWITPPRADD